MSRAKRERRRVRDEVNAMLGRFVAGLRAILKAAAPAYYARFPDAPRPCHTCAFNPGTDGMKGFDATALALVDALAAGRPFFCHEPLPYVPGAGWTFPYERLSERWLTELTRPCAGWWLVKDDPDARRAFTRACAERPLTDRQADMMADSLAEMRRHGQGLSR